MGIKIMDLFKDFIIGYGHESNAEVNMDEKLSVGCLLVEHQMPLMEDSYYLESQVLQFLCELSQFKRPILTNAVFKVYQICFTEEFLFKWTCQIMEICCRKLV